MKQKLLDEIKEVLAQSKAWLECEADYIKLTAAEKFTVLMSSLMLGAVCLALGLFALALMSMALVDLFKLFMTPSLAFLSVAGIVLLIALLLFLLRKPLIINPIARFLTRLFLDKKL